MIKLFTDTCANLPLSLIRERNITVLAFSYMLNGVPIDYDENTEFDGKWFYDLMRKGVEVKTSLVNVDQFTRAFEKELKLGNDVLYIGMSGGVSGTANAARIAIEDLREEYPECKIAAIDSIGAGLGLGLQVIAAADMIDAGKPFYELVAELEYQKHYMCQYFTVEDLQYLRRGGRISGASALIGNMLSIKPVLVGDAEGHIVLHSKVRGTRMVMKALVEKYNSLCRDKSADIGITHADNPEAVEKLITMLREVGFTGNVMSAQFEPVCGAHVGPGSLALFFWGIHK